ncbi:MAG: hypothetical protein DME75_06325 [Verrucomicrobia bacterium]|nr:MAG: hypothetical protein DME75_06325 [Verrucomicrobiota bacterium]
MLTFGVANSTQKIRGLIVRRRKLIVQSLFEGCIAGKKPTVYPFLLAAKFHLHAPNTGDSQLF